MIIEKYRQDAIMNKHLLRRNLSVLLYLVFMVSTALIAGCSASGSSTSPTIVSVSPEDRDANVPIVTSVSVTFSQAMNTASAEGAFSINPNVPGTFSWDDGNTVMTFNPSDYLADGTQQYTCTVGMAAQDIAGNALSSPYQWRWTTWSSAMTKLISDSLFNIGYSVTTDPSGNTYLAGILKGTADFGAYFGTPEPKTSSGSSDIFITKITADGTYGWTTLIGGAGDESEPFITTDPSGNAYLSGISTNGIVDFGTDFEVTDIETSSGSSNSFLTKINADGTYAWTQQGTYAGEDSQDVTYACTEQNKDVCSDNLLSGENLKGNLKRHIYNYSKVDVLVDRRPGWGNLHLEGCSEASHVVNGPCTIKPNGVVEMEMTTDNTRYSGNIWFRKAPYGIDVKWVYYEGGWFTKCLGPFCIKVYKGCSMSLGGQIGRASCRERVYI